jgi:DNA-binding GntR family transcriptional regulator
MSSILNTVYETGTPLGIQGLATTSLKTGADLAEEALRSAILGGQLPPGAELPEAVLGAQFGLSRTPIREALLSLQAAGLVETTRGRVARVRQLSFEELVAAYELRAVVEGFAARLAATRTTPEALTAMRESCARFDSLLESEDASLLFRENDVFHGLVHANCGNLLIAPVTKQLVEMPLVYSAYAAYTPDRRRLSHLQHEMILDALERHDEDAAQRIMEQHINDAGEAALRLVRSRAEALSGI